MSATTQAEKIIQWHVSRGWDSVTHACDVGAATLGVSEVSDDGMTQWSASLLFEDAATDRVSFRESGQVANGEGALELAKRRALAAGRRLIALSCERGRLALEAAVCAGSDDPPDAKAQDAPPTLTVEALDALLVRAENDFGKSVRKHDWRDAGDGESYLDMLCEDLVDARKGEFGDDESDADLTAAVNAHRPLLRQRLDAAIAGYVDDLRTNCECTGGAAHCSTCRTRNE